NRLLRTGAGPVDHVDARQPVAAAGAAHVTPVEVGRGELNAQRAADALADLVPLLHGRVAEVDPEAVCQEVEVGLDVGELPREGGARFVECEVAAVDLLEQVGGLPELP